MDRKCIIIGAAPGTFARELLDQAVGWDPEEKPYIYCADGGIRHAGELGLTPDMLIGDMDSAAGSQVGSFPESPAENVVRLPREKDVTDLFACVEDGLAKGFRDFTLIFCTGGRIDHFMAAAAILEYLSEKGAGGRILDSMNEMTFMRPGSVEIPNDHRFEYLSVIPLDQELSGITLAGVKYPLENATVRRPDMCLLISNEITGGKAVISTARGNALIIRSRDMK